MENLGRLLDAIPENSVPLALEARAYGEEPVPGHFVPVWMGSPEVPPVVNPEAGTVVHNETVCNGLPEGGAL